jgi:hypothetical protein
MTVLALKEYLTIDEAAAWCCLSVEAFEAQAERLGILSFTFADQRVFRLADCRAAMERAWRASTSIGLGTGGSCGSRAGPSAPARWGGLPKPKPRRRGSPSSVSLPESTALQVPPSLTGP